VSIGQATAALVELTAHRYPFAFRITATEACPRRGRAFRVSRKRRGNVEVEKLGVADVELVTGRHSRRDSTFKRSSCRMKSVIA
jgi:hypothetical protein